MEYTIEEKRFYESTLTLADLAFVGKDKFTVEAIDPSYDGWVVKVYRPKLPE